jgi:hypothetical protein
MEKVSKPDNNCCKDEIKIIKNDSDQKSNSSFVPIPVFIAESLSPVTAIYVPPDFTSVREDEPIGLAPPRTSAVPVFVLDRSFLI